MTKKNLMQISRIILGGCLAVVIPFILLDPSIFFAHAVPNAGSLMAIAAGPILFIGFVVVGLPSYVIFQHLKIYSLEAYVFTGLIAGIVIAALLAMAPGLRDYSNPLAPFFFFGMLCSFGGVSSALIFWLLVRPDKRPGGQHD